LACNKPGIEIDSNQSFEGLQRYQNLINSRKYFLTI